MNTDSPDHGPSITTLLMRAKHHPEEAIRVGSGLALVEALFRAGGYRQLALLSADDALPPEVCSAAGAQAVQAAYQLGKALGCDEPAHDLATGAAYPPRISLDAGMFLLGGYSITKDESGLWRLAKGDYAEEVRAGAGNALISIYADGAAFSGLFELATDETVIYEARKPAGFRLIELAVEHGNYPVLMRLAGAPHLPVDVLIALDGRVEAAAAKSIDDAIMADDRGMLAAMSGDARLPQGVRREASFSLSALGGPSGSPNGDSARHMVRLARKSNAPQPAAAAAEPPQGGLRAKNPH